MQNIAFFVKQGDWLAFYFVIIDWFVVYFCRAHLKGMDIIYV